MKPATRDAVKGAIIGAMLGALSGMGLVMYLIGGTPFFPWDVMVVSLLSCAFAGYRWGDRFFDWLDRYWTDIVT